MRNDECGMGEARVGFLVSRLYLGTQLLDQLRYGVGFHFTLYA